MSISCHYELSLCLKGPFISQASGTLGLGMDSAMLRYHDKPVINGSLIRGNLREALLNFACRLQRSNNKNSDKIAAYCARWFGEASTDYEPQRANLHFDLFWTLQDKSASDHNGESVKSGQRTRIQIDDSGKVDKGALQVIEDCFPLGSEPEFTGIIRAYFQNPQEKQQFELLMKMALEYIPALGSFKGIGFGRLESGQLIPPQGNHKRQSSVSDDLEGDETRIAVQFQPDRPFCLGKPRSPQSNRIVSETVISGNVFKALIAQLFSSNVKVEQQQRLKDELCFDELIVSHFVPVHANSGYQRPLIPLSVALTVQDEQLNNMAFTAVEQYDSEIALAFQPDWKDKQLRQVKSQLQSITSAVLVPKEPEKLLLVRTGIDSARQASAEGQLFTLECVDPTDFVWNGYIDLSRIDDEAKRKRVLANLRVCLRENELVGMGKTKAVVDQLSLRPAQGMIQPVVAADTDKTVTVTLKTAARLFPQDIERQHSGKMALCLYKEYWQLISEGHLKLVRHFAQQERKGGAYHASHFQQGEAYAPEWLTTAGSVFVLEVLDSSAIKLLNQWQLMGLPASQCRDGQPATWQDTPYLPEHGFGEIELNWEHPNCPSYTSNGHVATTPHKHESRYADFHSKETM